MRQQSSSADTLRYGIGQTARVGWYLGHYIATRQWMAQIEPGLKPSSRRAQRAERTLQRALVREGLALLNRDLRNIRAGRYPLPRDLVPPPVGAIRDVARYWRDLPNVALRRRKQASQEARKVEADGPFPRYYLQNFHFQSGGWLTEESAKLYDTQVEILFGGVADAMRRQGLLPIGEALQKLDSDAPLMLDLGTGTGNFPSMVRQAFPSVRVIGLDLSPQYLDEAKRRIGQDGLMTLQAPAEAIPLADNSVDLVTSVYLFHELPAKIRAAVLSEAARVLKPGGRMVLVDALQLGDIPALDPVIRSFPVQFHEPYFLNWIESDLAPLLEAAGLMPVSQEPAYLSKVIVADKPIV